MKQFWNSYHVFLAPTWLKLVMYLAYPLMVLGVSGWLLSHSAPKSVILTLASILIIMMENILDLLIFEGIAAKDTNKLEYLKTSVKGMKILRDSVVADAVRRAIMVVVMLGILWLVGKDSIKLTEVLLAVFVTIGSAELGLMVTRSITVMTGKILAVYLGTTLSTFGLPYGFSVGNIWGNICIAAGVYLIVVSAARTIIMRRARGSFYDK